MYFSKVLRYSDVRTMLLPPNLVALKVVLLGKQDHISWKLVKSANSWAPSQNYTKSNTLGITSDQCFNKPSR